MSETIGKYRVLSVLGQGAMGRVLRAEDPHIGRQVAIKVMTLSDDTSHERFQREARIVGGLCHPNIVVVHDFGFHGAKPYLVMELLDGTDLKRWMESRHRLDEQLQIMAGLCSAVTYAHGRGVLHRDIKPANVQVLPSGHCKLMDFGIARGEVSDLTASGTVMGTPTYIAPEILSNKPPSTASDIYAVGMVCYEMLTGRNPFVRDSMAACLNSILTVTPRHLRECRPDLPQELAETVMHCIEKEPARRAGNLNRLSAAIATTIGLGTGAATPTPDIEVESGVTVVVGKGRPTTTSRNRTRLGWSLLAAALVAMTFAVVYRAGVWSGSPEQATSVEPAAPTIASSAPDKESDREPEPGLEEPSGSDSDTKGPSTHADLRPEPGTAAIARPALSPTRGQPTMVPQPQPTGLTSTSTVPSLPPTMAPAASPTATPTEPPRPTLRTEPAPVATPPLTRPEHKITLTSVEPSAVRLGASVHLRLSGTGFHDGMELEVLRGRRPAGGFQLLNLQVLDATLAEVDLLIDNDIPLGRYIIVVVATDGRRSDRLELDVSL